MSEKEKFLFYFVLLNFLIMKKRILHVERHDNNYLLLKLNLRGLDVQLIHAESIEEAERLLQDESFDLIISNTIEIPGELLIQNLRAGVYGKLNRKVPAIAYTVASFKDEKEACLAAGFNDHISLPDFRQEINQKIKEIFGW